MTIRKLTKNQNAVLITLFTENSHHDTDLEDALDIDQLLERVPYETTKETIQFTLRSLGTRGYAQKGLSKVYRRGKWRVVWKLTESGQKYVSRR